MRFAFVDNFVIQTNQPFQLVIYYQQRIYKVNSSLQQWPSLNFTRNVLFSSWTCKEVSISNLHDNSQRIISMDTCANVFGQLQVPFTKSLRDIHEEICSITSSSQEMAFEGMLRWKCSSKKLHNILLEYMLPRVHLMLLLSSMLGIGSHCGPPSWQPNPPAGVTIEPTKKWHRGSFLSEDCKHLLAGSTTWRNCTSLTLILKKDAVFNWTEQCQNAFEELTSYLMQNFHSFQH